MIGIWNAWMKATDRSKKMECKHWKAEECNITGKKCTCGGDESECDISKELEESQENCSGQL